MKMNKPPSRLDLMQRRDELLDKVKEELAKDEHDPAWLTTYYSSLSIVERMIADAYLKDGATEAARKRLKVAARYTLLMAVGFCKEDTPDLPVFVEAAKLLDETKAQLDSKDTPIGAD